MRSFLPPESTGSSERHGDPRTPERIHDERGRGGGTRTRQIDRWDLSGQPHAPRVRYTRTPDFILRARLRQADAMEPTGEAVWTETPAAGALPHGALPSWLQPFLMAANVRFTRTPDYVMQGRPRLPAAETAPAPFEAATFAVLEEAEPTEAWQDGAVGGAAIDVAGSEDADHDEDGLPFEDAIAEPAADIPLAIRALARTIDVSGRTPPAPAAWQDNAIRPRPPVPARPAAPAATAIAVTASFDLSAFRPLVTLAEPALLSGSVPREPAPQAPRTPVSVSTPATPPSRWDTPDYDAPPLDYLAEPSLFEPSPDVTEEALEKKSVNLQQTLQDFGIKGEVIDANPGPVVTLYELEPAPGTKSSRVISLADDIARSMSAVSARVAVVPGRNAIGIELPNQRRETVWLRELLASQDFEGAKAKLALCLGKTIGGEPVIADLARMPHLLVAGTTGSGKSVAINTMILSLLYRHSPDACRLIMIDPKMLELSVYDGIPHLLTPVVTDPKKAVVALKWAVREMEDRYKKMSKLGVRNIDGFNARVTEAAAKGEEIVRTVQTGFDRDTGEAIYEDEVMELSPIPYIVVIVDEMADLMMVAGKDIEGAIQRLAQMARAAGIHVVLATQRPSVDVITGTIKANFPTRISFQVTSKIDSRTILGEMGAEQLLGQGDMLYMAGGGRITRVHGPFVSDEEVEKVVAHLKTQGRPDYLDAVTQDEDGEGPAGANGSGSGGSDDPAVFDQGAFGSPGSGSSAELYDQAVAVVLRDRKASTSYIQRRLQIGYNRAASLMERMEHEGIVGQANHAGKREILVEDRPEA